MRVATLVCLALLAIGCGKVKQSGGSDDGDDGEDDGSDGGGAIDAGGEPDADSPADDAAPVGCTWDALSTLPFAMVNGTTREGSPALTGSALLLFLTVAPAEGGPADVFDVARDAADAEFSAPREIPEVNSAEDEHDLEISVTGEEIFFLRGAGADILTAGRVDPAPFGEVTSTGLSGASPSISTDGLGLYFLDLDLGRIVRASRAAIGEPWGEPVDVGPSGPYRFIDVSSDERRLLLSGGPGGSPQEPAVAIATRAGLDEPFGEPESAGDPLDGNDVTPLGEASWDAGETQMVVTVEYGNGSTDLYVTTCQ